MKCPVCGNECRKGLVEVKNAASLTQLTTVVSWFPEEQKNKFIRKDTVTLPLNAEGYYCEECMKVFAVFTQTR